MKKIKPKTALAVGNRTDPYLTLGAGTVQSDRFWRWGDDNLFPAALALMSRRSTTHRRIINDKADYISGKGVVCDTASPLLARFVEAVNGDGESLRQLLNKLAYDKSLFGNAFLEVVTDARRSFLSLYHQDARAAGWPRIRPTCCCTTTGRPSAPKRPARCRSTPSFEEQADGTLAPRSTTRTTNRCSPTTAYRPHRRLRGLGHRLQDRPLEHFAARQLVPALGRDDARQHGRQRSRSGTGRADGRGAFRRQPRTGDVRTQRGQRERPFALHPDRFAERRRLEGAARSGRVGHRGGAFVVPLAQRTGLRLGVQRGAHPPRIRGGAQHRHPRRTGRAARTHPRAAAPDARRRRRIAANRQPPAHTLQTALHEGLGGPQGRRTGLRSRRRETAALSLGDHPYNLTHID